MARESTHDKLGRVRPPRVSIKYEVHVGDAIQMKELPFVVGVMADLSGKPETPLGPLKDPKRKFVEIDRDNFNDVMKGISPRLAYQVENKLSPDGGKIGVELKFNHLDDFSPEAVANHVAPLKKLVEVRQQLTALLAKTDGNDSLAEKLQEILTNMELQQKIGKETGKAVEGNKEGSNG